MWTACQCRGLSQSHCWGENTTHPHSSSGQLSITPSINLSMTQSVHQSIYQSIHFAMSLYFFLFLADFILVFSPTLILAVCEYIKLATAYIYWSRKLDGPSEFHAVHFLFLHRSVLCALAEVCLPLKSVVRMTSGLHNSWLSLFYGSSSLHLKDPSSAASLNQMY